VTATYTFTSKADVAYAQIRDQILAGVLPAGSKLSQYDLAADMGISITPLREAIRRLSGEGLIVLDTHRNARVATMDFDEARQLHETRRAIEPAAVELAAERRTDADIDRMREALKALMPVTRRWGEPALAAHRELHQALYHASHNAVMIRLLDDLWDKSDRYRRVGMELPPGNEPRTRDSRSTASSSSPKTSKLPASEVTDTIVGFRGGIKPYILRPRACRALAAEGLSAHHLKPRREHHVQIVVGTSKERFAAAVRSSRLDHLGSARGGSDRCGIGLGQRAGGSATAAGALDHRRRGPARLLGLRP
jgi:DNA-binding GntR family transcriptional regulator